MNSDGSKTYAFKARATDAEKIDADLRRSKQTFSQRVRADFKLGKARPRGRPKARG